MPARYVTAQDVAARYDGQLPAGEWVATLVNDAEQVIRDEVPGLDARVADGRVSVDTLKRVVAAMVLDVVRNPAGFTSQTAGEFSYSYGGGKTPAGGRLQLSGADRRALVGRPRARTLPDVDTALPLLHRPDWGSP